MNKTKFLSSAKKFFSHEVVCLIALLAAVIYDLIYMFVGDNNPITTSLSDMGRINHPTFIAWGALSALALILNMPRLYSRVGVKPNWRKAGYVFLGIAMVLLTITCFTMRKESEQDPIFKLHFYSSILFAVFTFFSLMCGLIPAFFKNKQYKILVVILLALLLADMICLGIYKQMGIWEFIPLILAYIVFFFTNYTKTYTLETPVSDTDVVYGADVLKELEAQE